jgi:hypothetical protein
MSHLVSTLHDAATVSLETWPLASGALTHATGVAGAALIIFNKSTGKVDEAYSPGLSAASAPLKHDARRHIGHSPSSRKPGAAGKFGTEGLVEGSRFYFHIENGKRYPDETGSVFSTSGDAAAHAFVIAKELAPDKSWHESAVLVTDDRGQEIVRVPIGPHPGGK